MSHPQHTRIVKGWIELLFKLPSHLHKSLDDIHHKEYMMVGGAMPISEFDLPFDVLEWAHAHPEIANLPRALNRHDLINFVTTAPKRSITTFMVIHPVKDQHLLYPGARVQYRSRQELCMFPLQEPLKSAHHTFTT